MTPNEKELLVERLIILYKKSFNDKRVYKDLSIGKIHELAIHHKWHWFTVNWETIKKNYNPIRRQSYALLERLKDSTQNIELPTTQKIQLIELGVAYDRWHLSFYGKQTTRTYKGLKLIRLFDFLAHSYQWLPIGYIQLNKPLGELMLTDLKDTFILQQIASKVAL